MEQDSCSMTPPMTPLSAEFDEQMMDLADDAADLMQEDPGDLSSELPVHFCCAESRGVCNQRSEQMERLLRGVENDQPRFHATTCCLYGYQFLTAVAWQQEMDRLFMMARQHISTVNSLISSGVTAVSDFSEEVKTVRMNVVIFLEYIKYIISRHPLSSSDSARLRRHLQGVLLHIGRLSELPAKVINSSSSNLGSAASPGAHHAFHLHLDVHWTVIEIFYLMSLKFEGIAMDAEAGVCGRGEGCGAADALTRMLLLLLWDLTLLANQAANQVSLTGGGDRSMFACACVEEIWMLVMQMLNVRSSRGQYQSFWTAMQHIFEVVLDLPPDGVSRPQQEDSDVWLTPPSLTCERPVSLCWSILSQLAGCSRPEENHQKSANIVNSKHAILKTVLRKTLDKKSADESQFRSCLQSCLVVCRHWQPNADILGTLWEHFYKRLNERFHVATVGMETFTTQSVSKSSALWLDEIKKYTSEEPGGNLNSFQVFLKLLSLHLRKKENTNTACVEWKQVKGRFYSKFHTCRMQELTALGLQNLTSLFLTLACVADTNDVIRKLCDLYGMLSLGRHDNTRHSIVMKGLFAAVLLYQELGADCGFLTERLHKGFTQLCRDMGQPDLDLHVRHSFWSLVSLYLDSTQDVLETSVNMHISETQLIGPDLADLLRRICNSNELCYILGFLQSVLAKLRSLSTEEVGQPGRASQPLKGADMAECLWRSVYPWVREYSCTQTPPPQLSDLAVEFTLLSLTRPPTLSSGIKEDFSRTFLYFVMDDAVNADLSCRYLCHIMSAPEAAEKMMSLPGYGNILIRSWVKCSVQVIQAKAQLVELTRLVLRHDSVGAVFASYGGQPTASDSDVILHFIRALAHNYAQIQDFQAKVAFREQMATYFAAVSKHASVIMKNGVPTSVLRNVYNIAGHLAKFCAPSIYIKSKPDCLFPSLLDKLILPRALLNPNKQINSVVISAIRDHLHLFIQGLGKLDYRKDPFVQRKMKDIIKQYFERFSKKPGVSGSVTVSVAVGGSGSVHPILSSLSESCGGSVSEDASDLRQFILEIICTDYLPMRASAVPNSASMALAFVSDLLQKSNSSKEIAKDSATLCAPLLEYMLLCDSLPLRTSATRVLEVVLTACRRSQASTPASATVSAVRRFVLLHIRIYPLKVMAVLDTLVTFHPNLVVALIPDLTKAVKDNEIKRGVGTDSHLRQVYISLLTRLGEVGDQEAQMMR